MSIKERASVKAWVNLDSAITNYKNTDRFWCVEEGRADKLREAAHRDIEIWNYIYTLIEKDRR